MADEFQCLEIPLGAKAAGVQLPRQHPGDGRLAKDTKFTD